MYFTIISHAFQIFQVVHLFVFINADKHIYHLIFFSAFYSLIFFVVFCFVSSFSPSLGPETVSGPKRVFIHQVLFFLRLQLEVCSDHPGATYHTLQWHIFCAH